MKEKLLIATLMLAAPLLAAEEDETIPLFLESRIYAANNPAFGIALATEYWGLDWHLGGYLPADDSDNPDSEFDAKFDYGVAKSFAVTDDLSMSLGIGALETDMYADYGLDFDVTKSVSLQAGYRFHFDEDFDNRNEYYLGFAWLLNAPDDEVIPSPAPIPEPIVHVQPEIRTEVTTVSVPFELGSTELIAANKLDELIQTISTADKVSLTITGHADNTGSPALNDRLTKQRAEVVKEYLIRNGLSPNALVSMGMGTRHPIADNNTEDGRAKNRRVEVRLDATFIDNAESE